MSVPINQEHKEAEQLVINKERDAFIKTLPKKERAKFVAISEAVETLRKAGVLFYLFPYLPSTEYKGKKQVWQWNSLGALMKYDDAGKPQASAIEENKQFHEAFFYFLFGHFAPFFEGESWQERLENLPPFFFHCLKKHQEYLENQI